MIIVRLCGGLGNQLFQFATGYSLAKERGVALGLDLFDYSNDALRDFRLDEFSAPGEIVSDKQVSELIGGRPGSISRRLLRISQNIRLKLNKHVYVERGFEYDEMVVGIDSDCYLDGYWQSQKYFLKYREDIQRIFSKINNYSDSFIKVRDLIIREDVTISIHVRRGDYLNNPVAAKVHGICPPEYYNTALDFIRDKVGEFKVLVFSDDKDWVNENLDIEMDVINADISGCSDVEDMLLMSLCDHNIIANSSFSWWGAWLNRNPGKIIIAPKSWFLDESKNTVDLIPNEWVRL